MTISVRESGMPQTVSKKLALDERPALDLQAERDEEGGHDIEVCNRDADVVEAAYMSHGHAPVVSIMYLPR
jgi:hypothetical protein